MPIIQEKPSTSSIQRPTAPIIESPLAKSVLIDNNKTRRESLITHVSGIALTVDYYSLVVNKDNALYSQDVGQSGVQQQYILYKNFEIRQSGSLSQDQNDEDKVFTVNGTGIVHSGLIPNEGDMFSCDVGDGRVGVFNVKRSQQLSINKNTTFQIEYGLSYFADAKQNNFLDLKSKVTKTYHYVKDRLNYNEDPFLTTDEFDFFLQSGTHYHSLITNFKNWFFSKEFMAYIVPDQTNSTFDYFMYKALRVLFKDDYFVIVDEVSGSAKGSVNLHYQMPKGEIANSREDMTFLTQFEDGSNMKLQCFGPEGMSMKKEPGWCSTAYRKRYKRMNVSFNVKKDNENAVRYITVIYPVKKSADAPKFDAKFKNKTFDENGLEIEVKVNGKKQSLKYKL
jgi:hypothetical protein